MAKGDLLTFQISTKYGIRVQRTLPGIERAVTNIFRGRTGVDICVNMRTHMHILFAMEDHHASR